VLYQLSYMGLLSFIYQSRRFCRLPDKICFVGTELHGLIKFYLPEPTILSALHGLNFPF
jgi:hypothetical protein